jgi:hypothetical protein
VDTASLSVIAALAGSAIGGATSLAASWLTQRVQFRAQRLAHDIDRREDLYKDFIEQASESYTDAIEHDLAKADVPKLVRLYALVSRMRVLSSQGVIEQADRVMRDIIEKYLGPNKAIREVVADSLKNDRLEPLRDFSSACRDEFRMETVAPRHR